MRVGPNGTKAKWVRIELRKVETLPGGGQSNTFYDFVGPSPVNLWTASDEYGMLKTVRLVWSPGILIQTIQINSKISNSQSEYPSQYRRASLLTTEVTKFHQMLMPNTETLTLSSWNKLRAPCERLHKGKKVSVISHLYWRLF